MWSVISSSDLYKQRPVQAVTCTNRYLSKQRPVQAVTCTVLYKQRTEQAETCTSKNLYSCVNFAAVVTKFREGLNMAGKFLGLNTAQGVAHLVSSSLLTTLPQWPREETDGGLQHGLFSGFFRLLGLDSTKLGAIALNVIIFIAQLVSITYSGTQTQYNHQNINCLCSCLLSTTTTHPRHVSTLYVVIGRTDYINL